MAPDIIERWKESA